MCDTFSCLSTFISVRATCLTTISILDSSDIWLIETGFPSFSLASLQSFIKLGEPIHHEKGGSGPRFKWHHGREDAGKLQNVALIPSSYRTDSLGQFIWTLRSGPRSICQLHSLFPFHYLADESRRLIKFPNFRQLWVARASTRYSLLSWSLMNAVRLQFPGGNGLPLLRYKFRSILPLL